MSPLEHGYFYYLLTLNICTQLGFPRQQTIKKKAINQLFISIIATETKQDRLGKRDRAKGHPHTGDSPAQTFM